MTPTPTIEEKVLRRSAAVAAATAEALNLREIERLHREKHYTYAAAMRKVGLVLPHSTLRKRLHRLEKQGVEGLLDRRHPPPSRLTPEIRGFIEGVGRTDRKLSVTGIIEQVRERFGVSLKARTVETVLKAAGVARPVVRFTHEVQPATLRAAAQAPVAEPVNAAGMVWLTVADDLVDYTAGLADVIKGTTVEFPPATPVTAADREHRDERGRFLPEYNAPEERRYPDVGARFESVELKREDKDLGRLRIVESNPETLRAKLLTLMAMPMVTECGRFDGATDVRGTWLAGLGGLDYMPETLAKFARELKWAGVSGVLLERHAQIWHQRMASWVGEDACASILYVDATTKPFWTQLFHRSGRVAMLGRVMPCVETVMIHKGAGIPLWIRSYSGHVALVNNVLPLIDELESAIGEGMLGRLTVIDGEMDCVSLFKQFDARGRSFITPLDRSRCKDLTRIKDLSDFVPYRETDLIASGTLQLKDSLDPKGPPYQARVIALKRRTKAEVSLFATNAPARDFSDPVLMDAYFSRWPNQEHVFRTLNGLAGFKAVHGMGKRRVHNITVIDAMTKISAQLERLEARAQTARETEKRHAAVAHDTASELEKTERTIVQCHDARRELRDAGNSSTAAYARQGERLATAKSNLELHHLRAREAKGRLDDAHDTVTEIEEKIARKKAEWDDLSTQREIYETDVELDQTFSVLKVGFALLLQYLLHAFFGSLSIDLVTFANQLLLLPGERVRTDTTETVRFQAHRRNPPMMAALEEACAQFNALRHHHDGRLLRFEVLWPPGTRGHAR